MKRTPMKRTAFKRKAPQHQPAVEREPKPLARATRPATYAGATTGPADKASRKHKASRTAELIHKGKLAEMGCMVCRRLFPQLQPGPVELHHLREGGWGKGGYLTLIPLCVEHHRGRTGVHGLGTRGFVTHYGFTQADLLRDALGQLEAKEDK